MGTFWIGQGVGITFQLKTMATVTQSKDLMREIATLNSHINKDIYQTFEKEGALEGHSKWAALSPAYAKKKKAEGFGEKILTRKWKLGDAASNGHLVLLNRGDKMALGYRMGGDKSKVEKYLYAIYFGRPNKSAVKRPNPKTKRRFSARVLSAGTATGSMPGRPFIRIRKETVNMINDKIGRLWAERKMKAYFTRMANE